MKLSDLIEYDHQEHELDPEITGVTCDSRKVKKGYIFIAVKGDTNDGADYINQAIENGAVAIIMDNESKMPEEAKVITLMVADARNRYAEIASKLYPDQPNLIVAVTGTNGKTSTVHLCRQIWQKLDYKAASIGTIGLFENDEKLAQQDSSNLTTPDPLFLHEQLDKLAKNGVDHVAIEASSHGISQHRLDCIKLRAAAFTNFTEEHLDYHKTMDEYFKAKLRLFTEIIPEDSIAIINADIEQYQKLFDACQSCGHRVFSYGKKGKEFVIKSINYNNNQSNIELEIYGKSYKTHTKLEGNFQIYNILCAVALCIATGSDIDKVIETIPLLKAAPGRMQKINGHNIYIDYSHTPDALEKALTTLKEIHPDKNLKLIFGCGGDRDKEKRPMMGKIAQELADDVIITDDNPRTEDPAEIRKQILATSPKAIEIDNREEAIKKIVSTKTENDVILIAGKGHENYQLIGNSKIDFDDLLIAQKYL